MGEGEGPLLESPLADDQLCTFKSGELWAEDANQGGLSNRRPIAQRARKVPLFQFKVKLADLIQGLLSAKIIQHSTSPWASPIVIIVKKNGVDIKLCIDNRLVNDLTQLMFYPMPLINELLEDLNGALWYYSLDVASGFWVNTPQIYQRLLDNALYGFLRISQGAGTEEIEDLFPMGKPDVKLAPWYWVGQSYIVYFLLPADSWDMLCAKVKQLFIEDNAVYTSILYELWEVDFYACRCKLRTGDSGVAKAEDEEKWSRAQVAFAMRKNKIATAPILRHFEPSKEAVIIVYASKWAISASLVEDRGGILMPVTFTSRTIKANKLYYSTWRKKSTGLQGRLDNWAALIFQWTIYIVKCNKGGEKVLGALAASITPHASVDSILSSIAPKKQARQVVDLPTPTVEPDEELYVMSFDGSARAKQGEPLERRRLIIYGDSNLVSADQLASTALRQKEGIKSIPEGEWQSLKAINRLSELLVVKDQSPSAKVFAVTRSRPSFRASGEILQKGVMQRLQTERIREAQEQEDWVQELKAYLKGDWFDLSMVSAHSCSKMARDYEISEEGLPLYCPVQRVEGDDREVTAR
ncbi:unnamed protein product [Peronospora belbahrii]|uniref:Reverse transcriptase/retrotransposon-derived protein RNase H-like domain-containing protein n=1 Tax=Peronospora belbahrii TaxID=622444 RepID=A0AAU9KM55_9STRA|nr:unnamed protein product [Peronospora belbahrii]